MSDKQHQMWCLTEIIRALTNDLHSVVTSPPDSMWNGLTREEEIKALDESIEARSLELYKLQEGKAL